MIIFYHLEIASNDKLKFQTFDNDGQIVSDAWTDLATTEWNTNTNKATVKITDDLLVGTTNILTTLNTKTHIASPTFTGTATVDNLKVITGVSTDSPLGLTLGGSGVNTLGGLTVNGDTLLT